MLSVKIVILVVSCGALTMAGCPISNIYEAKFFSTYTAEPLDHKQLLRMEELNNTGYCAIPVKPCDPNEGRRVDGTCNSLRHPSRGTQTPFYRVLPAAFDENFEPRLTKSGYELPLTRHVRNHLLPGGKVPHQEITHLLTYNLLFFFSELVGSPDTVNYIFKKTYCCQPEGRNDPQCAPHQIPDDDPYFRHSDIRCLNMTKPLSYQDFGCIPKNTVPERVNLGSPLMDLGLVYGVNTATSDKARMFQRGLLKTEVENGVVWPPSVKGPDNDCVQNHAPLETRCHDSPEYRMNTVLGLNLFSLWYYRMHNKIATELAQLNPCWDDDMLFFIARDINIAISQQIFLYELLSVWMGRENLLSSELIQESPGFRDIYDDSLFPQVSLEVPYVLRWGHLMQNTDVKFYDATGRYLKSFPMGNLTLRTGYLALDNNLAGITQGSFRQACGAADNMVDTDLLTQAMGELQRGLDLLSNDLAKGRYYGIAPYVKYREFCTGKTYNTFDDLSDAISPEWIEVLSELYEDVEDIDLIAGMWVENLMPGAQMPPTVFCLAVPQFLRNIKSDRHWYERPNRPYAFSYDQLQEIRKASMARLLCDVGDSVTEIQPHAYLRARPGNEITSCDNIPKINLKLWKDEKCVMPLNKMRQETTTENTHVHA